MVKEHPLLDLAKTYVRNFRAAIYKLFQRFQTSTESSGRTLTVFGAAAIIAFSSYYLYFPTSSKSKAPSRPFPHANLIIYSLPLRIGNPEQLTWTFSACNVGGEPLSNITMTVRAQDARAPSVTVTPTKTSLSPQECHAFEYTLSRAPTVGWFLFDVLASGEKTGELGVSGATDASYAASLKLKIQTPQAQPKDNPPPTDIVFTGSHTSRVVLSNPETGLTPISWYLQVPGLASAGVQEIAGGSSETIALTLKGNTNSLSGFWRSLWPLAVDGYLVIETAKRLADKVGGTDGQRIATTSQYLPIKVRLSRFDQLGQRVLTAAIVFALLCIGGLLSLAAQTIIPASVKKRTALSRLLILKGDVDAIDKVVGSKIKMILGTMRWQLYQKISDLQWFAITANADLDALICQVSDLEVRLEIALSVAGILQGAGIPAGLGITWFSGERIRALCADLLESLVDVRIDPSTLFGQLKEPILIVRNAGSDQPTLVTTIKSRSEQLLATITTFKEDATWTSLTTSLTWLEGRIKNLKLMALYPGEQVVREREIISLELLSELANHGASLPESEIKLLLGHLSTMTWEDLRLVRNRIRNLQLEVDTESVLAGIEDGSVTLTITATSNPAREIDPLSLSVWFEDDRFNYATLRTDWACVWDFGYPRFTCQPLPWSIWRCFPARDTPYEIRVVALRPSGATDDRSDRRLKSPTEFRLAVRKRWRETIRKETVLGVTRALLVQLVPLCALLGTKGGDLDTRDPLSASLILVAAGFTTNTAKDLISTGLSAITGRFTTAPPAVDPAVARQAGIEKTGALAELQATAQTK